MSASESLSRIEARWGFRVPELYRLMLGRGWLTLEQPAWFFSFVQPGDHYLPIWEMEWIPPARIADHAFAEWERDDFIPFAHNAAGDLWCWWPARSTEQGAPVWLCPHDEGIATLRAPDLRAAMYRQMLELAAGVDDPEELDAVRAMLDRWIQDVGPLFPEGWTRTLAWIRREPLKSWTLFSWQQHGLITPEERAEVERRDLPFPEIGEQVEWHRPD